MPEQLFLIDAHSHIYQAFYAIKGLTAPDGSPANAVYGFARLLKKIKREYEPDYMAVVFDPKGEVFRHDIYDEYKATRKPMPDALQEQIPVIKEMLEAWSIPILVEDNYEADDVLAVAANQAADQGVESVLVTTDKDVEQCIDEHTSVLHLHKNKEELLDAEALKEKKDLEPWQIVEMMALAGDNSDNIPGIYRIGPKTATKLIKQFGSVDDLYDNLEEVSGDARRKRLAENRDQVELSRRLVTIKEDIPLDFDLDKCRLEDGNNPELIQMFKALGFRSLIDDPASADDAAPSPGSGGGTQGNLFDSSAPSPESQYNPAKTDYAIVDDLDEIEALPSTLRDNSPFSIDLETTSLEVREADIVGIALSWKPRQAIYIPTLGPDEGSVCPVDDVLRILAPVLEEEAVGKVGQNLKYDMLVLKNHSIQMRGIACDTLIASYLLNPGKRQHGLDTLAQRHLNYSNIPISDIIGEGKSQTSMDRISVRKVAPYACEDADVAFRLSEILMDMLSENNLESIFEEMEIPLIHILAEMEWQGIKIDQEHLRQVSQEFAEELEDLENNIFSEAGREFNVNSPQQLSTVLFDEMELPPPRGKKKATGYSTARDVLEKLAPDHPIAEHMLRWRELSKLKSTYADALLELVNDQTGRLHTSFNQTGTATGRLSSSDPNLQNIPVRTTLGRKIRQAFVPGEPDMVLMSADYSQVELRVLAHCSGDETLKGASKSGLDIHTFVAAQVNEVDEDEVTPEMRQRAKAVNFGIVYGQTPYGLSNQLDIPVDEAEDFIETYFDRYPRVREFIGDTVNTAREEGYVRTLAGRRRRITGIRGSGTVRSAAERVAVNSVIQGSAADMIKLAMIPINRELPAVSERSAMLLQIHDELLLEVPQSEVAEVEEFVVDRMTNAMDLSVPIEVDVATGANWDEAK